MSAVIWTAVGGRRLLSRVCFFGWAIAVAWLSLTPAPPVITVSVFGWDKLQHAASYALLTLLGVMARFAPSYPRLFPLLFAVVYGGILEVLQGTLTVNRQADWQDLLANTCGALLAIILSTLVVNRRRSG
jgi:VanZ family protein